MIRATTPTHTFTLPIQAEDIESLRICYGQRNKPKLIKELEDCTVTGNKVVIKLTEEETKLFKAPDCVQIQIRVLSSSGNVLASPIYTITYKDVLDDEVMSTDE